MNDLKNSVAFLFFFLLLIFGVAQVNYIEENVINFSPAFFVLIPLAVITGILIRPSRRISIYSFLMGWAVIYGLTWFFYWRLQTREPVQVLIIQFMLVEISAGLAFDVGRQIAQVSNLLSGLTRSTYPNRTIDLNVADDRVSAELTRSRRYQHPLSLLIVEMGSFGKKQLMESPALQRDILAQFAAAKVGQIISERARETYIIMRDQQGRFIVLCPETNYENSRTLADRIEQAVSSIMDTNISWGAAFFPGEALTFEDLILKAEERLEELRGIPAEEGEKLPDEFAQEAAPVHEERAS